MLGFRSNPCPTPLSAAVSLLAGITLLCTEPAVSQDEETDPKRAEAPGFEGEILGMPLNAASLAIVLDISESMNRHLPSIRTALREKMPRNPVLHVDGCGVERPEPRARIVNGLAPETITAIETIASQSEAKAILWITDLGDPPNRKGLESLEEVLSKHGLQLFLVSTKHKPSPSIRKIVEGTEGHWEVIESKP